MSKIETIKAIQEKLHIDKNYGIKVQDYLRKKYIDIVVTKLNALFQMWFIARGVVGPHCGDVKKRRNP